MRDDTRDPNGPTEGFNNDCYAEEWQANYRQARECGASDAEARDFADGWTVKGWTV